jgi:hypothetical protein
MNLLIFLANLVDRLDPAVGSLLDQFRDERVPLHLSAAIVAVAAVLLVVLVAWGAVAWARIQGLREVVRRCGTGSEFRENFARVDRTLGISMFGAGWREYRHCLKESDDGVLSLRRPDEYLGLHSIGGRNFPVRFFAAVHGYFIGVGLILTFVGLVAALKFAAVGVASPDLAVAKDALNALLAAASFKFMTSIAGLGSSLILSIAARSTTCWLESATLGLVGELERAMTPVFTENLAFDQLAATRAGVHQLERIGAALAAPIAPGRAVVSDDASHRQALQQILTVFLAEMRGSAGTEMKQLASKLAGVGNAIDHMQSHVGHSGQQFADQLGHAASRLVDAATTLQESIDGRFERVAERIDALGATFARGEALFSATAEKAAASLLRSFTDVDANLRSQLGGMRDIVVSLERAGRALDSSAASWTNAAAPVAASVDASRQMTAELVQVADRVGTAQRDMANMAKSVAQLAGQVGAVWDNYRSRFEKVDNEMQAVFERLQGGTRAFGEEVMDFVGKLDSSLANGMQAFSLGTEELREVAQMLVISNEAKAA